MKKFLLLLLIAGCGAYAYWPYHTVTKFEDALRTADKAALERIVDFPAVRQSLKDQVKAKMIADEQDAAVATAEKPARFSGTAEAFGAVRASAAAGPRGAGVAEQARMATTLFAGVVADKVIDSMVTPEAVTRLLKMDQAARAGTPFGLENKSWHSPTEFSARGADDTRFKFRLMGISGWRIVSVEPGERLGKQAQLPR